jgi:hypothetical protein
VLSASLKKKNTTMRTYITKKVQWLELSHTLACLSLLSSCILTFFMSSTANSTMSRFCGL